MAAAGGVAYAAGRSAANRAAQEQRQDDQIADLQSAQATVAAPPPSTAAGDERIRQLRELGELKASGVLSDEEFQREKARILGSN